jgi:transcriptional regulator with PAS, ATPase and Fis domain
MQKKIRFRINIFFVLLLVFALFSLVPIIILISQSIYNLDYTRQLANKTIETTFKEQTTQLYKSYAQNLAKRISDFLHSCESDLLDLSHVSQNNLSYKKFAEDNIRYVNSLSKRKQLYREISLIDRNGNERIKIIDGKAVEPQFLKNVSIPSGTTYLSETYFNDTKNTVDSIYVTRLTGWYVSRQEQLEKRKTFEGVIRFCKKITDSSGNFAGIYMIALDFIHLLDFVEFQNIDKDAFVKKYKTGSYTYILDDEGWIIAHQKLWDIRGLDKEGNLVEPLTEFTPKWKYDAGTIPINLMKMDWRLKDIYTNEPMSAIVKRVQRGETAITTMKSMGVYGESDGIVRTRAYAPIYYNSGPYKKYGIFGAVSVGTSLKKFMDTSSGLSKELESIIDNSKNRVILLAISLSFGIFILSFFLARWIAKPMKELNLALTQIGKQQYNVEEIPHGIDEINTLSKGVNDLARELSEKDKKINKYVADLEVVNLKLSEAKKELATYWRHEYEQEPDKILDERIKMYEEEYPVLKQVRRDLIIGNDPKMLKVLRFVIPMSQMSIPTWIYGETGVGKSALGYVIHFLSPRSKKTYEVFAASEFSAADPMIILGKLFGYGQGHGISGIDKNGQKGIIEECNGGTLLIDDVDVLPMETQAQILRAVDGLDFHTAAGKSRSIQVDVRFLFASHINLEQKVKEGLFRKDLYRRIGGSFNKVEIPPLRDRKSDIPLLADHFIKKYCTKNNVSLQLTDDSLNFLQNHNYSEGNVAELRVLLEIACESARIEGNKYLSEKYFPALNKSDLILTGISVKDEYFSNSELKKLKVLRENGFKINICEETLGFKKGSHTLSHHLKGICFKALQKSNWEINKAVEIIAGTKDPNLFAIVKQRIEGYIQNLKLKDNENTNGSLLKKLPKEYHNFLLEYLKEINS